MPFPIEGSYILEYRPKVVLEYPEHAARIGLVSAEWAALEDEFAHGIAFALFAFSKKERGAHRITRAVLQSIDSLNARCDVAKTILRPRAPDNLYEEFSNDLWPEMRRRAKERNRVVHGHWKTCTKFPKDLILDAAGEEPMRYTTKCLDDIADRINETMNKISTFNHRLQTAIRP